MLNVKLNDVYFPECRLILPGFRKVATTTKQLKSDHLPGYSSGGKLLFKIL